MGRREQRIERLHKLRERAAEWAARHHPDQVEAGLRSWIGARDVDPHLIQQGVAFALILVPDEGPSLLERFRATRSSWPRMERTLFRSWERSWFGLFEVHDVLPGQGAVLDDVVTGERHRIVEESASSMIERGDWLAAVLMPIDDQLEFEGTLRALPHGAAFNAVRALLPYQQTGWPERSRRRMVHAFRAVDQALRPPKLLNHDLNTIELLDHDLDLSWDQLVEVVRPWPDMVVQEDCVIWTGRVVPALLGPLVLASFQRMDQVVSVHVNSRARLDALQERFREGTGHALGLRNPRTHVPDSDPDGRELLVDSSHLAGSDSPTAEGIHAGIGSHWMDEPVPALDGLSPRQATAVGRRAEVWSILPSTLGLDTANAIRGELGFPLLRPPPMVYDADMAPDPAAWGRLDREAQLQLIVDHHELDDPHEYPEDLQIHASLHGAVESHLAEGWAPAVETLERFLDAGAWRHDAIHAQCTVVFEQIVDEERRGSRWSDDEHAQALAALDPADWIA